MAQASIPISIFLKFDMLILLYVTWFSLIVVRHAHTEGSNLDLGFSSINQ